MKKTLKTALVVSSFARLLAIGRQSGAVSTDSIREECLHLARLHGGDGVAFYREVIAHRNDLLFQAKQITTVQVKP